MTAAAYDTISSANYGYSGSGSYENSCGSVVGNGGGGYGAPPAVTTQFISASSSVGVVMTNQRDFIADIFASVDRERNGRVSYEEAERLLLRLNSRLNRNFGEHDMRAFFQNLDVNRDGSIDLKEFRAAFERQL